MAEFQKKMLQALSMRAKEHVEYYEFVILTVAPDGGYINYGGGQAPIVRKVYLCVAKAQIIFLRQNLHRMAKGGTVQYKWLDQIIEDKVTGTDFELVLNRERQPDCPPHITISSQHRTTLLKKIAVAFMTDTMLRVGQVVKFPCIESALEHPPSRLLNQVQPFQGCKRALVHDYYLFLPSYFEEDISASGCKTGVFKAPVEKFLGAIPRAGEDSDKKRVEVSVHVYDQVLLHYLRSTGREHVRWLAMEYKQALLKTQQTYVLRNKLYLKKMNLANDLSAWVCWELFLQDRDFMTVVVLLRRQYPPPLVNSVQDFALMLKCPANVQVDKGTKDFQEDLIHEAHLMADTLSPQAEHPTLCTDVIQTKLDALLYDNQAYGWIRSRLKLKPDGASCLEKYATIFVKGIFKILRDENALEHPELWDEASKRVAALCEKKTDQDLDPITVSTQVLRAPAEGVQVNTEGEDDERTTVSLNAWHARVAQYLSYCADGGLFGSKFTIADIITNLNQEKVSKTSVKKLAQVMGFLLHLRPLDLGKPWEPKPMLHQLIAMGVVGGDSEKDGEGLGVGFNDHVMQALVETGYVRKLLPASEKDGEMSPKYASFMTHMLRSEQASVNLKAAICRQAVAAKDTIQGGILCHGLVHVLNTGGLFLATYATAALVNLSTKEVVKTQLMSEGTELVILNQLESKDDDLTLYTLMLMVNLTKQPKHRHTLVQRGVLGRLYRILSANYAVLHYKQRVLTELCSVLGQLCNDEETRKSLCEEHQYVIDCLLQIFEAAQLLSSKEGEPRKPGDTLPQHSTKIISKALFALKQLCANSADNKDLVGARVIKAVVKDLNNPVNLEYRDWATNAILLVLLLAISHTNCEHIRGAGWSETYQVLSSSPLGKLDATRDRIHQISDRVDMLAQEK